MSPSGPFYCVFRWDLTQFSHPAPVTRGAPSIREAGENEYSSVARVWHTGLAAEPGEPWAEYLRRWSPDSAKRWFLDARKRLGGKILVAEGKDGIVGVSGLVPEKNSGIGRMYTGVVVLEEERRRGVGSLLLYRTLVEAKNMGLHFSEVETLADITASRYLYHKFGGVQKTVPH